MPNTKKRYNMKDTILAVLIWLFVAFLGNLAALWAFNVMDSAWESRAKAAGYYETLPDSMKK